MEKTPLEAWISEKISHRPGRELTRDVIQDFQLDRLRQVIDYVVERSPFYREQLRGFSGKQIRHLEDISSLPLTTAADLQHKGMQLLCISQGDVERIVTLQSPESPETPRRIHFSAEDLELTVDFFHHGMTTLVSPGQKVLILMPGERPGSVGDLLAKGLSRAGVMGIVHGIVLDRAETINEIVQKQIDCLVGIPIQVLSLARHETAHTIPHGQIKSILLSADYVPSSLVNELQSVWGCKVFGHYGTTEMGLGGGVECEAFSGYHLREADLLFEIIDPATGEPVQEGRPGEIVFTTLTREAMPLIRFRTGDLSRFIPHPCPCGTVLRRMEKVRGKINEMVRLRSGDWLAITDLDEALFGIPGIVNYVARIAKDHAADRLELEIYSGSSDNRPDQFKIRDSLASLPAIARATAAGQFIIEPLRFSEKNWITNTVIKRTILRKQLQDSPEDRASQ